MKIRLASAIVNAKEDLLIGIFQTISSVACFEGRRGALFRLGKA